MNEQPCYGRLRPDERELLTRCPDLPQFLLSQKAQGQGPVLAETGCVTRFRQTVECGKGKKWGTKKHIPLN